MKGWKRETEKTIQKPYGHSSWISVPSRREDISLLFRQEKLLNWGTGRFWTEHWKKVQSTLQACKNLCIIRKEQYWVWSLRCQNQFFLLSGTNHSHVPYMYSQKTIWWPHQLQKPCEPFGAIISELCSQTSAEIVLAAPPHYHHCQQVGLHLIVITLKNIILCFPNKTDHIKSKAFFHCDLSLKWAAVVVFSSSYLTEARHVLMWLIPPTMLFKIVYL